MIVQGQKRAYLDGTTHIYDREQYLCSTLPIPAEAEVIKASPEKPLLGLLLSLETRAMFETVLEMAALDRASASRTEVVPGLTVAKWDENFATGLQRLLELLDDPVAIDILSRSRLKELMFAVLRGEAGGVFFHAFGGGMQQISRALTFRSCLRQTWDRSEHRARSKAEWLIQPSERPYLPSGYVAKSN